MGTHNLLPKFRHGQPLFATKNHSKSNKKSCFIWLYWIGYFAQKIGKNSIKNQRLTRAKISPST